MPSAIARVATSKPSPYLKQLCRHFGHRNEVTFDDEHGEIHLPSGVCRLEVTGAGELMLTATATEPDSLDALTHVIGSHLERFGSRDGLSVEWSENQ
jgi:hypothetical protein